MKLRRKSTVQNLCYLDLEIDRIIERERDLAADDLKAKAAIALKRFKCENPLVRCFHDGCRVGNAALPPPIVGRKLSVMAIALGERFMVGF